MSPNAPEKMDLFRILRRCKGDLKRRLFRRISFDCHPLQQLESLQSAAAADDGCSAGYAWRSLGDDPSFLLQSTTGLLPRGWYMIEILLDSDVNHHGAYLYFDSGKGFEPTNAVMLPLQSGKVAKRLCYLPEIPNAIRFDPAECACRFNVRRLDFVNVSQGFAFDRIHKKLQVKHSDYQGQALKHIRKVLRQTAKKKGWERKELLLETYADCFKPRQSQHNYEDWMELREKPFVGKLESHRAALLDGPLFSVLLPVYNSPETYLRRAIDSVLAQTYPNWELCIVDDCSTAAHVGRVLRAFAAGDARIKVYHREENGHIAAASNSALALATGKYVALLDHDDELAPHALLAVVESLKQHPEARVIYSDEDKIDGAGKRFDPHFKSDWNPDLFFSQNYISHLCVYERDLIRRVGGFRKGLEGSQDYDLLLRASAVIGPEQIVHIPQILYHWRVLEGSTALKAEEKNYTTAAGIRALSDYFAEQKQSCRVTQGAAANTYKITWPLPDPPPRVSLLIPTRDGYDLLSRCITSILTKTRYPNYEILIIDNQSSDPKTLDYLDSLRDNATARVLSYDRKFNYSAINNFGVKHAMGTIIGLINNDIEVISSQWLTEMVSHACRPEIGCVGAKLYYGNNTIQHAGVITGLGGVAGHSHKYFPKTAPGYFRRLQLVQNLSAVTAAALVVEKSVYTQVGGLNETDLTVAFNDVDFCLRVRKAGYRNLWTPYAELYHHESVSRGHENTPAKQKRFKQEVDYMQGQWGRTLGEDPYYSIHLTKDREDFSLA